MVARVRWILYNELVVGQGHPTKADVDNRPLRDVILFSGADPDSDSFPGFLVRYTGSVNDPNTVVVGLLGNSYFSLTDGSLWLKLTDNGAATGWIKVGGPSSSPVSPLTTKGDIYAFSTLGARFPISGINGKVLTEDSALTFGFGWKDATPLTSKGDLLTHNGTTTARQPVGTDGKVLVADSTKTTGLDFVAIGSVPGVLTFPLFDPNKPQASPSAKDDEFDDTTGNSGPINGLNARWVWVNQGGATVAFSNNKIYLTMPANTGDQWRFIKQALPSTPYRIVARVTMGNLKLANSMRGGIAIRDTTNNRLLFAGWNCISSGIAECVSVATTVTGGPTDRIANANRDFGSSDLFVEMTDDGTNLIVRFSRDGVGWIEVWRETRAALIAIPAEICIIGNNNTGSVTPHDVIVEFFRVLGGSAVPGGMRNMVVT